MRNVWRPKHRKTFEPQKQTTTPYSVAKTESYGELLQAPSINLFGAFLLPKYSIRSLMVKEF